MADDPQPPVAPASPPQTPSALVEPPRFSWKPPLAVPVKDVANKDGNTSTANFWLDVCPAGDGMISIAFRDFKFAQFNGKPASDPELASALSQAADAVSAVPKMLVSADGSYVGLEDPDAFLKRMEETFPSRNFDQLRSTMKSPRARAVFEQSMGKYWQTWVAAWLAFVPSKGLKQTSSQAMPGTTSAVENNVEFVWDAQPGFARIRQTTRTNGDALRVVAAEVVAAFGAIDAIDDQPEVDGTFEATFETVTRWPDVRPRSASWRKVISLSVGGKPGHREEQHDYAFDWQASSAAAAQCR